VQPVCLAAIPSAVKGRLTERELLFPLLWILPLAVSVLYVGSPRFIGTQAARRAAYLLKSGLDKRRYTLLSDLDLALAGQTVHFDHIVVSQAGIFVIDALHLPGVVSGSRVQARWQRKHWGRKYLLDNPVHENYLRLQALQRALDLPANSFHSLVGISGHGAITSDASDVVTDVNLLSRKINSQSSQSSQSLSQEQANQALLGIQQLHLRPGFLGLHARWKWLRLGLLIGLCAAVYLSYGDELRKLQQQIKVSVQGPAAAGNLDEAAQQKLWEDSLICSYSIDTQRCACYQPDGVKAALAPARCKTLAEKGSVLEQ